VSRYSSPGDTFKNLFLILLIPPAPLRIIGVSGKVGGRVFREDGRGTAVTGPIFYLIVTMSQSNSRITPTKIQVPPNPITSARPGFMNSQLDRGQSLRFSSLSG